MSIFTLKINIFYQKITTKIDVFISLGLSNTGRLVSAAPGAETRFRNGPITPGGGLLTSGALFNRAHRRYFNTQNS